jgi:hypothetical protein
VSRLWEKGHRASPWVSRMADRHYSRQTPGARQFCPPGQPIVLYVPGDKWPFECDAAWAWWRPHPDKAKRMDNYDGWWQCSLFRNESDILSSTLIEEAILWANEIWGLPPHGYDTYVWPEKIRSSNPGYCYQVAGWQKDGWSKDGKKRRLYLPVAEVEEVGA